MRKNVSILTALLFVAPFIINAQSFIGAGKAVDPYNYTTHKDHVYNKGAVVSAHPLEV